MAADRRGHLRVDGDEAEVHRAGDRAAGEAVGLRVDIHGLRGRDRDVADGLAVADLRVIADPGAREAVVDAVAAEVDHHEGGAGCRCADRRADRLAVDDLARVGEHAEAARLVDGRGVADLGFVGAVVDDRHHRGADADGAAAGADGNEVDLLVELGIEHHRAGRYDGAARARRDVGLHREHADRDAETDGSEAHRAHRHIDVQVLVRFHLQVSAGRDGRTRFDRRTGAVDRRLCRRFLGRHVARLGRARA